MTRRKLIVANWKMNHTVAEALKFLAGLRYEIKGATECEVVIIPPFTTLYALEEGLQGTPYKLGAQNMHWEDHGAFTGEISPAFLRDLNIEYVLLGHSERRDYFAESDETVNKKLKAAIRYHLKPIVCMGETEEERRGGKTKEVVTKQVRKALDGQFKTEIVEMVWAYEPRWAIGTGKNATPEQAQEVIGTIRGLLAEIFDDSVAATMRILYGGSVSETTAGSFLKQKDIDGLLVGGASLDPKRFAEIIQAAE